MSVLHRCDNPPCCNPAHLFLGTHTDNMRDAVQKQRQACGERSNLSRLKLAQVKEIIAALAAGGRYSALSRQYGVTPSSIAYIARGGWRTALAREQT